VEPPPRPALTATSTARRVVLVSFDGLGADALARQPGLTAFDQLASDGGYARVIPVNPTLTSSTHVSILTGADPQRTGIVSNRFHLPGTPEEQTTMGMDVESDVETIVESARRQGKRVGAMFPTVDARTPRRTADFGVPWTSSLTRGRFIALTREDFRREWVPPTWTSRPQKRRSFSPIRRARIEWSASGLRTDPSTALRASVDLVAYDTTDDRVENYDGFLIESGEREIVPDPRGWFAIAKQAANGVHGSWSKIVRADPTLDITLYWGPISRTNAYPDSYRAMLDTEVGFWPGVPDQQAGIDAATFSEQLERLADFYTRAQTLTIARMEFDLLLAYQPQVDEATHEYLGKPGGDTVIRAAFETADRAIAALRGALDPAFDALIVTGDHGLVLTERNVAINRLLAEHGFAPRWRAYPSSSVAHVYRFSGPDDSDAVVALLTSTGHFERVEKKTAASHRNSGDVIAWAWPNVSLTHRSDAPLVSTPEPHGQHGALNTNRELHTVLFAAGAGIPRGNLGEIQQTEIARFVAELFGVR
jgi:predicted AlkP superfamily pyrophosphatase or phosphodiesterase